MAQVSLAATSRTESGKGVARSLRREGRVPATMYGHGMATRSLSVDHKVLAKLLEVIGGEAALVDVSIDGSAPVQALVRTCAVEYLASARFDDALLVRVRASYLGHRSCRFEFLVDNIDTSIRHLAAGVTLVCVQAADRKAIAWPRVWIDRLAELEGTNLKVGQR